jgi:hypothetical protein
MSVNLAPIPNGWDHSITGQRGIHSSPYIIYPVTQDGRTAIKMERDPIYVTTNNAVSVSNELNALWLAIKPGDHIVFKMWLWSEDSTVGDNGNAYAGAMMGIDVYGGLGRICGLSTPDGQCAWPNYTPAYTQNIVPFGSKTWTQKVMDFTVQPTYIADPYNPSGGNPVYAQVVPNGMIPTLNLYTHNPTTENACIYVADVELYINPTTPPPPPINIDLSFSKPYQAGNPVTLTLQ